MRRGTYPAGVVPHSTTGHRSVHAGKARSRTESVVGPGLSAVLDTEGQRATTSAGACQSVLRRSRPRITWMRQGSSFSMCSFGSSMPVQKLLSG